MMEKLIFVSFLCLAAWQDFHTRTIAAWVYAVFGFLAGVLHICYLTGRLSAMLPVSQMTGRPVGWVDFACGAGIGMALLLIGKVTEGAIGSGDGWFFLVSGLLVGFWKNLALLCYGLLFCCGYCLLLSLWGAIKKISVRKRQVPFLPFVVPAGIWIAMI